MYYGTYVVRSTSINGVPMAFLPISVSGLERGGGITPPLPPPTRCSRGALSLLVGLQVLLPLVTIS